jgi:hypothetical protein
VRTPALRFTQLTLALLALTLPAALLRAQSVDDAPGAPDARLQAILNRAAVAAAALQSSLPSFACKENVRSQEYEKKKLRRHAEFNADIRVQRRPDGSLTETFQPEDWTVLLKQSESGIPFYVSGGFQSAMEYFVAGKAVCYRFSLPSPQRIDFSGDPAARSNPLCDREEGLTGFALLDTNGDVIHIERRVSEENSRRTSMVPFAAIDLAPVELNGRVYRLSTHLSADTTHGKLFGHFEADYSSCRLFGATVTILPSIQPIQQAPPPRE